MTCYEPVKAYRSKVVNPATGKRGLAFRLTDRVMEGQLVTIPCGRCKGCRSDRARDWGIRCAHEAQVCEGGSVFVTLTYDQEHLPPDLSVSKREVQLWMKRLREVVPQGVKLRFYGASEYGEKRKRPHYHYLVYGYDFPDRTLYKTTEAGHRLWCSELLSGSWGKGLVTFGAVTFQSARYCAGYIMDKELGVSRGRYDRVRPDTGEVVKVEPEFSTMSLKPGIGHEWYRRYGGDVWPSDFVVIDGGKMKPPIYYEQFLDEASLELVKRERKRKAVLDRANNTPMRRAVREECFVRRLDYAEKRLDD